MKVKMILPALTEARSPYWRPLKYSLFPPLGLAQLAAYLSEDDQVEIQDEHVETVTLDDEPDLVVIQTYITCAYRAYKLAAHYRARGAHVCLGGLHITACPEEAARHADTIFCGPGEDTWPRFLADFKAGHPAPRYLSTRRTLDGVPPIRRDVIERHRYLVPNSIIVSRGCPHACDFCYKDSFFQGGKSFYVQKVDEALAAIEALPGKHLFFLDDNLFADRRFAMALFDGMQGMGRLWQAAGTVSTILDRELLDKAVACGLRSLFVGFETFDQENLKAQSKTQNVNRNYDDVVRALHGRGVMINTSFVFGMDADTPSVFDRTTDWAISQGIETATFHILTPYPGTRLYQRMYMQKRIIIRHWSLYDTRHCVYRPARMTPRQLEDGYRRAYERFYRWSSIWRAAGVKPDHLAALRHLAYCGAWKKCEALWRLVIKTGCLATARPLLEKVLAATGPQETASEPDAVSVPEVPRAQTR